MLREQRETLKEQASVIKSTLADPPVLPETSSVRFFEEMDSTLGKFQKTDTGERFPVSHSTKRLTDSFDLFESAMEVFSSSQKAFVLPGEMIA